MDSRRNPTRHIRAGVFGVALAGALALAAAFSPTALGITQDEVISRAQRRVNAPVPYSQREYYGGYRTDCSGYVSMCWKTGTSWSTRSFYRVTHRIPVSELRRGDAMLKKGYHIRLFYGWLDEARSTYVAYESAYGTIAAARVHSLREDLDAGYVPVRYDNISTSPASRNVLQNGAFTTWARSWDDDRFNRPLWWETSGPWWGAESVQRRADAYRSRTWSAGLMNPSAEPDSFARIAQTVRIVPKAVYRLSAYAKTPSDPALAEMRLEYLDAEGTPVSERSINGGQALLDAIAFRAMSILATAPAEATHARVSLGVAGGGSTDASGTFTPGTALLIDDVVLARPQASVTIQASRTSAYRGTTVRLSGTVNPRSMVGQTATFYVRQPGSAWRAMGTVPITAADGAATWKRSFTFTRSMPRGTYAFRVSVPRVSYYLGSSSPSAKVRLR